MKISIQNVRGIPNQCVTWTVAGKTKRKYWPIDPVDPDKAEATANKFAKHLSEDIREVGSQIASVDINKRAEVVAAMNRAAAKGYDILEACLYYEEHFLQDNSKVTLGDLRTKFMAAKQALNLRTRSLDQLKWTTASFVEDLGSDIRAASITPVQIEKWLDDHAEWKPKTRKNTIGVLRSLFGYGVKVNLLANNPVTMELPKVDNDDPVNILDLKRCKDALVLVQQNGWTSLLPWLVLSLFAGIRQEELRQLDWSCVNCESISLKQKNRGRGRRLIRISKTLQEWLALCDRQAPIVPPKSTRLIGFFRNALGGHEHNVLRHTWISNRLALTNDENATAVEAGNSPQMIQQHYREVVTKEHAEAFFALTPAACRNGN